MDRAVLFSLLEAFSVLCQATGTHAGFDTCLAESAKMRVSKVRRGGRRRSVETGVRASHPTQVPTTVALPQSADPVPLR